MVCKNNLIPTVVLSIYIITSTNTTYSKHGFILKVSATLAKLLTYRLNYLSSLDNLPKVLCRVKSDRKAANFYHNGIIWVRKK